MTSDSAAIRESRVNIGIEYDGGGLVARGHRQPFVPPLYFFNGIQLTVPELSNGCSGVRIRIDYQYTMQGAPTLSKIKFVSRLHWIIADLNERGECLQSLLNSSSQLDEHCWVLTRIAVTG